MIETRAHLARDPVAAGVKLEPLMAVVGPGPASNPST